MGIIRGNHVSPGVYTRITNIERKPIEKSAPLKKLNVVISNPGAISVTRLYYGFYKVSSKNGEPIIDSLTVVDENIIKNPEYFNYIDAGSSYTKASNKKENVMPENKKVVTSTIKKAMSETDFKRELDSGKGYKEILDKYNYCQMLSIPKEVYDQGVFDIYDVTLNKSIKDKFVEVGNNVLVNGKKYVVLAMFDKYYAYVPIPNDVTFSNIELRY